MRDSDIDIEMPLGQEVEDSNKEATITIAKKPRRKYIEKKKIGR